MFYVLQYPNFTTERLAKDMCDMDGCISQSQVFNWLLYGKLPESIAIQPTYQTEYVRPDGLNRYISDVTVLPIPPFSSTVQLAVGGVMEVTIPGEGSATTTDPAIATENFVDGKLTITGVAAGTATITAIDKFSNVMGTIAVTVA